MRSQSGQYIPKVFVTTADGSKGIEAITYEKLKADARGAARELRKKLEEVENILGEEAEEEVEEPTLLAETQEWTNSEGTKITAAIKKIDGSNVIFLINNQEVPYQVSKLSEASQRQIKELLNR